MVSGLTATDTFTYDSLHRLTSSTLNAAGTVSTIHYGYDSVGNLLKKTDYSTNAADAYRYLANSNKISEIDLKTGGTSSFTYDKKGNLTHRNSALETSYNAFNKPLNINRLGANLTFTYGADLARYKQVRIVNGETITTHYIGKLYEVEKQASTTTTKAYISDIAIVSDNNIRFTLRDRLGSATTFTDELGNATGYRHFDPFGKSKSGDWRELNPATLANNPWDLEMPTRRGFTDHEHLDDVELIHMNGRVYDYNVGRFMSVDPVIQSPGNSQSINPYSYIMNNPLAGTDPTGYMGCAASRLKDVCDDLGSSLGGNGVADKDLSKGLNKFDNGARVKRGQQSKTTEINAQEELAEAAKKEALASGGSGGAGGEQRRADEALFDDSPLDGSEHDQAFAAANDDSDDRELSAGVDWSGGRALAYQLAGRAGVDAYNQGVDTGLEIGLAIAPLPPLISGARYIQRIRESSKTSTLVIGKMDDLAMATGWKPGDFLLNLNKNSSWAENKALLNQIIKFGKPIKDKSPFSNTGFLRKERKFLTENGWKQVKKGSNYFWVK